MLRHKRGLRRKLQVKYDGPLEVLEKISPITYQLQMPASYRMHPVLNIAHLEQYIQCPKEFREWLVKHLDWADFTQILEYEVETILRSRWCVARNGRKTEELLTKFVGYDLSINEWLTRWQLRNAPQRLQDVTIRILQIKGIHPSKEGHNRSSSHHTQTTASLFRMQAKVSQKET